MRSRTVRGAIAIAALTSAALIGTAGSALACHSDDTRPHPTPGSAKPCAEGTDLGQGDVEGTVVRDRLSITKVNPGVTVKRIVVVGGDDGFNDYTPGANGLDAKAPWNDLRAPFSRNGQQPGVEKWFLCGTKTAPVETTKPTTKPTETTTVKPTETTSAPVSSSTTSATPSTTAVVPAGNESGGSSNDALANTGFDNSWLIWIAAALLVVGGGLLFLLKFRRKASE